MAKFGINHRQQLGWRLNEAGLTGVGAEIGVLGGENAFQILNWWNGKKLILVDPYKKWAPEEYIDGVSDISMVNAEFEARERLERFTDRVEWWKITSDEAFEQMEDESLDFCYIDGNHHLPIVRRDIENGWKKVKSGGVLCGHDYYDKDLPYFQCHVKSEVDRFAGEFGLEIHDTPCTSWWILKP